LESLELWRPWRQKKTPGSQTDQFTFSIYSKSLYTRWVFPVWSTQTHTPISSRNTLTDTSKAILHLISRYLFHLKWCNYIPHNQEYANPFSRIWLSTPLSDHIYRIKLNFITTTHLKLYDKF
jgi:hypothetical protein